MFTVYGSRLEKSNDVYLPSGRYITIDQDSFTGSAPITPYSWKRGTQVLDGNYASSFLNNFSPIDGEWHVVSDSSVGKLDAEIYVSESKLINATGYTGDDTTGRGTQTRPYATIQRAVKETWKASDYTIYVNGTLTATSSETGDGKGNLQNIPDNTFVKATSITLSGSNSATINANSKGSALTISKAIPVTIKNIKITGGSAANGGGILVNGVKAASLTLTTGTLITANTATKSGGGIYFAGTSVTGGTANLTMNDTAKIDGNTASGTGSNDGGGGVYLSYANLCMSGKSVIGDTSGSAAATSDSTGHSNTGYYGGGVYAYTGGNVYVGYENTGTTDNAYTTSYGILHNYSSRGGGGINISDNAKLYLAYGSISKNGAGDSGGAVTIQTSGSMTMSGGAMALNSGVAGGAVAVVGTFEMTGGTIGNASKTTPATGSSACSNYASDNTLGGGAIWAVAGSTVTVTGGTIAYNYSKNGGAIYASGSSSTSKATVNLGGGTIKYNGSTSGGGVYIQPYAEVKLYGSGVIDANQATYGGGVFVGGTSTTGRGKLLIYGDGLIGKSGNSPVDTSDNTKYGNKANYGGGICSTGTVCIGYSSWNSDTSNTKTTCSGGVRRNYSTGSGGGIYAEQDYIYLHAGQIAYNYAAGDGGGIAFKQNSSWAYLTMDGGYISNNNGSQYLNGGGVYADHGSITMTGGSISSNKANYGGGVYIINDSKLYVKSGASISSNECTSSGGAVFAETDSSGGIYMYGSGEIPKDASKKNTVYLAPQSANATKIRIMEDMSPANRILLEGNSSYFYKANYTALTVGGSVNLTNNYTFFEINSTSWCVCCDGTIQPVTYLTSSNIASFTPTASTEYNFKIASGVTSVQLNSFFENLCNSEINTSKTMILASSTLDLSEVSLASLSMTFDKANLVVQPFKMVVLPASVSATQLTNSRLVWCLSGAMDFSVPPTNTSLCSENGIVYNKSKTKLVLYPGNKTGLSLPTLPNTLTTIGENSFSCAQNLSTVNIPNTVTTIESGAFRYGKITSVSIPTSISSIPMECFLGCENLATVQLPNTLTTINSRAFQQCGISSININNGALTTIDYNAFDRGFSSTTNVTLTVPSTVKLVGSNAFASNSKLSLSFYTTSGWKKRSLSDPDIEENWTNATTSDMTGSNFTSLSGSMHNYYVKHN